MNADNNKTQMCADNNKPQMCADNNKTHLPAGRQGCAQVFIFRMIL
ncbi:hypothetical protein KJ991_02405 [Patescibacteria group bacterium]|nr:hypothetical protein [Patescibacteria group bacterium]MBU4057546.1 hypothetical protein [Patescibacteria group bacterium]MBU4115870.1 hypothetical protein [Patescibacteria group bacterium]